MSASIRLTVTRLTAASSSVLRARPHALLKSRAITGPPNNHSQQLRFKSKKHHHDESAPAKEPASEISFSDVLAATESKMTTSVDWYTKHIGALESRGNGRVTPALVDSVRVSGTDESGAEVVYKLRDIATIGVKEGSTLMVTVFEESVC